jgi:hypothetical protein
MLKVLLKAITSLFLLRMMAGGPTRHDTFLITVQVADPHSGVMIDYGIWDKKTGGAVDSSETKYFPGGMGPPISLGGRRITDNITVERLYRLARDHAHIARLMDSVGHSTMTIAQQPLDIDGNSYGTPIVWTGTLKKCTMPDADSETTAAALVALEMSVEGYPDAGNAQ